MTMFKESLQNEFNQLDSDQDDYLVRALACLAELNEDMLTNASTLIASINYLIAKIDAELSQQVSKIIHHPDFQSLESTWNGVYSLAYLPINGNKVKVRILDLTWEALSQNMNNSISLRRTLLYNLVGNRELNTSGGQPFGMLLVDHAVTFSLDQDYDDIYTLELLAGLGDLCLCPFIFSPADDFFGEKGADWLSDTRRVEKILSGSEFTSWQRLRGLPEARYLGMAMPRVKLRDRYTKESSKTFLFDESLKSEKGLWGSAAFLFASITMREFNRINWFGFMKSRWQDQYSGALVNVPKNNIGSFSTLTPTPDVRFITSMGVFYAEQGFIPLCHSVMTDKYFFRGNNSVWKTGTEESDMVMAQLQTTLMVCRIAHYLKVQIRGMIGNFQTAQECEQYLNRWLDRYSSNLSSADEATLARYPLSKGSVTVKEIEGEKGRYSCDVLIQPQYQFDHVCGEMMLSTDLGSDSSRSSGALV